MLFRELYNECREMNLRFISTEAPVMVKVKGQPPFAVKRVVLENDPESGQTVWLDAEEM